MSPASVPAVDPWRIPDAPPPDVLDEIAVAAHAHEQLTSAGREVRLDLDPVSGRLRAELIGPGGRMLAKLTATDVIDMACGERLPLASDRLG
ncbi:MAG: hypothetical protein ACRDNJ_04085 [Solirubrobacteraceae bacterium]